MPRRTTIASAAAVGALSYAALVMSNHYHVVLHINSAKARSWSDFEVCQRWHALYDASPLTQKCLKHEVLSEAEPKTVLDRLEQWRHQLMDISWFMRNINEPSARRANSEDNCTKLVPYIAITWTSGRGSAKRFFACLFASMRPGLAVAAPF